MSRGLILFAHGSRDPAWGESLHALAREIEAADPGLQVRCAFLERLAPDLPTVLAELAPGLTRLDVCPVFWAANGHVQRDLPALLEDARRAHPGVELRLLPVLSELPGMLAFLARTVVGLTQVSPPATGASGGFERRRP
jgi:sirohydrochlorin cobaltochelatase